ncbi:MAG: hypothetical protein PHC53_05245 [Patescibacteria group bacterium]|nr:hypothetical protein [Patescibacteria group bacterium]
MESGTLDWIIIAVSAPLILLAALYASGHLQRLYLRLRYGSKKKALKGMPTANRPVEQSRRREECFNLHDARARIIEIERRLAEPAGTTPDEGESINPLDLN